jgi:SNF2 family DNA or RNA helicase
MDKDELLRAPLSSLAPTVLLRRTVADVRDVVTTMPALKPMHRVIPVTLPSGGEEESVFQSLVGRLETALDSHASTMIVLELYLRIRQFVAHPVIYVGAMRRKYKERYAREAWTGTASKTEAFQRMLATNPAEPTIVFTTFKQEMELAELHMRAAGYKTWTIGGGMTDDQRSRVTSESSAAAAAGTPIGIIVQIVAGGAGLNLQHCSRVCFLSSHWNPAVVDQAIARAYRMGQTKHVTVLHFLIADDAERNIDRRMASLHGVKRDIAVGVHPKLFCDSAIGKDIVTMSLDAVLESVVVEED